MFVKTDSGLQFEVLFRGKENFGVTYEDIHGKCSILANSDKDIILDFKCFAKEMTACQPHLLLELYVDGVLRNVVAPRTGRGLAETQIAEASIDRGIVLSESGMPLVKKFRFQDLDLDDAILTSRLVKEAGIIEVRITQAGLTYNEEDDITFDLPGTYNDRCAISLFCGELNNTIGVRFDDGDDSIRDTKDITRERSIELMLRRQNEMLGETLAIFSFQYASYAILLHLGLIPTDHKLYNAEMTSERLELRTRYNTNPSQTLIDKAVSESDYSLLAMTGGLYWLTSTSPQQDTACNSLHFKLPFKRSASTPNRRMKKSEFSCTTPKRASRTIQALLTPPMTPKYRDSPCTT